jgi:thymidine kinase
MNARLDADGDRVWEGEQVDIGHHYVAMSRKEFQLDKVTPVAYEIPEEKALVEECDGEATPAPLAHAL